MPLTWNNDDAWILRTERLQHGFAPPYVGNGRVGLRLGALVLGTDRKAPPLVSAKTAATLKETPPFDHTYPLQSFAAFARDVFQYCLPSWANIDLTVGGHRFEPEGMAVDPLRPLSPWLDLRTGEAGVDGTWCCGDDKVAVRIRLLIPRSHPHGAFWELELDGLKQPTEIIFGLDGRHLAGELPQAYRVEGNTLLGTARTQKNGRTLGLGLRWQLEGAASVTPSTAANSASVRVSAESTSLKLRVFYAVRGGTEAWKEQEIPGDLAALEQGWRDGSLRADNARRWRELWAVALDVTALPLEARDRRLVLAQHFYLLASYDGSSHPTAALGLSDNGWGGQQLWDTDLWHFRALNAFWPELARQPVRARLAMLPNARRHAASLGLQGAWFGWMCDEEGNEMAPPHYRTEIHVNAWIALAAWHSTGLGRDVAWLKQVFPVMSGIADATCSRAERDADGSWHLRRVLPPDESVVENPSNPGTCDDSVLTNVGFRTALRAAVSAAKVLGQEAPRLWSEVADGLVVLVPGPDGIIPEYAGYSGHDIKQADVILAFWPLETEFPDNVMRTTLDYYRERAGGNRGNGPLMTGQIDACIRLRHGYGDREEVLRDFIVNYRRYVRGAFEVPYECPVNTNSLMLTGCGGFIAALTYGWFKVNRPEELSQVPRLGCA